MNTVTNTLPAQWYYDPEIFEKERKSIFAREWIYAAQEVDFQSAGSFVSFDIAGYPIFLLKGKDQTIRAFHNVCRHRAAPLVTEKKGTLKGNLILCQYHGWSYDLTGELSTAPYFETTELKKNCDLSLFQIQVGIYSGLIFINLDKNAPPFLESFHALSSELSRSNYDMQAYTIHESMVREGNFNWKTWMDGFQECYHCSTIHPVFNNDFYLRKYKIENKEKYSVHSCERKTKSGMGEFQGLWLWNYPNLGLPCYENCFYTLQVNPIDAQHTQLNYHFRFKPDVSAESRNDFIKMAEKITTEDILICEKVQKNLAAGIYKIGVLHPERENGVEYLHTLIKNSVGLEACQTNL